jgi:hypothetical protein
VLCPGKNLAYNPTGSGAGREGAAFTLIVLIAVINVGAGMASRVFAHEKLGRSGSG